MKSLYFIALLAFTIGSQAQTNQDNTPDTTTNKENTEAPVFTGLQVQPEYPGGTNAFLQFISDKYRKPKIKDTPRTVKFGAQFVIEKDGSLTSIKILNDPGEGIGDELVRVLKKSKKWKSAIQNGKPVRAMYTLPMVVKWN